MSDRFFVVTGGPGAGKTSLIEELARRGFHTIPESGRAIIQDEMRRGGSALPWADRTAFAERMLQRDLDAYRTAQTRTGPVIFDRGVPDILGYLTLCRLPVPPQLAAAAETARYNRRVFLAPYWDDIFTQDAERKQSRAEAEATCAAMRATYAALGYDIMELPRADTARRADIVAAHLEC
ncbi:AAA family ATPase [Pontibaca methylaminivorans]|uniref:Predicted ATPase n=1 Tax=Pontibaca methylaminivorans TaxID=515897 RepID=A0A1R3WGA3_9RHOB|nr:AAA family ATPase [Pontibaca methylaminivorans]SIT77231.1 Predicted ATPase [Pontibaca methylaminivorans]